MTREHASKIVVNDADDTNDYRATLTLLCACDWSHTFKQDWDRYAGYELPVTMEQLWAIWMKHLGDAR